MINMFIHCSKTRDPDSKFASFSGLGQLGVVAMPWSLGLSNKLTYAFL